MKSWGSASSAYLDESTAWMVEASQRYQVALKNSERLIDMQPMQINLRKDTALFS